MISHLNHVALLVTNIESFVRENSLLSEPHGQIDEFPSEGTRELYLGKESQIGRLLLMQAIGEGPYRDAYERRGAGLHHIAIDVPKVDDFVGELSGSGWFLHPRSLWFYDDNRQVFLSRPGVPVLIEVQERPTASTEDPFIDRVEFPFPSTRLLESLCCSRLKMGQKFKIFIEGRPLCPSFDYELGTEER